MHPSREPVVIEPYSGNWIDRYQNERRALLAALPDPIIELQHVGSTSVPGLAAKPTVDIMLGTKDWPWPETHDATLATLGYRFYKAPTLDGHWRVYLKALGTKQRGYHLHLVEHGTDHWRTHLLFRDYLRAHPGQAKRYEALKRSLAERFGNNRSAYQNGKAEMISELTRLAQESIDADSPCPQTSGSTRRTC
jgi:GrpB-like predicted nucleotidyltransferase (UPF0157 family)